MEQPHGFVAQGKRGKVHHLHKSLYSLKQPLESSLEDLVLLFRSLIFIILIRITPVSFTFIMKNNSICGLC